MFIDPAVKTRASSFSERDSSAAGAWRFRLFSVQMAK